ncbi:MAG TPA: hypothetical protein VND89_05650 [Acidimicrobiales bacterium]|nr:hypothetical protein [Acidimicrobiales bacterium]
MMQRLFNSKSARRVGVTGLIAVGTILASVGAAGAANLSSQVNTKASVQISSALKVKANQGKGVNGIVTASSSTSVTITNSKGASSTYAITPTTTFTSDHKAVTSAAVTVGELVRVVPTSASATTAASISVIAPPRNNEGHGVNGVVTAVSPTSLTITRAAGVSTTYVVTSTTTFTSDHKAVTSAAVTVGELVRVVPTSASTTTASSISILANGASRAKKVRDGVVTATSTTSLTVTNARGFSTTYVVSSTTRFTSDHRAVTSAAVTVGELVRVEPTSASVATASNITVVGPKPVNQGHGVNGVVTAVTATSLTITSAAGVSTTYVVSSTTTFTSDHKAVTSAAVTVGELVRVVPTSASTTTAASIAILVSAL